MLERILIVGLGSIGTRHAQLVRELMPDVQIAALRHQRGRDAENTAINCCYTNLDEALKFQPQVAVIANPATYHLETALSLARAGVHLLIEKPLAASSRGIDELIETCSSRRIVMMVAYNLRFLPSLQKFRELLGKQRVGRVLSVRAEIGQFLPSWRPSTDYRQTVSAQASLGGGALLELSHEIDYLRWLFGEVNSVSSIQRKQSSLEIDVEDTAHLIMEFTSSQEVTPVIANLSMDLIRHDTTRTCTVIGETGTLRWNALTGTVELFEQGGAWQTLFTHASQRNESYLAEWRHFLQCIEEGTQPLISGRDGLEVLRIIEAARQSSATGRVVSINPI